jgi:hypothetical protein
VRSFIEVQLLQRFQSNLLWFRLWLWLSLRRSFNREAWRKADWKTILDIASLLVAIAILVATVIGILVTIALAHGVG